MFSFERYTLELYLFATRTVQGPCVRVHVCVHVCAIGPGVSAIAPNQPTARAFGRRLSWMALVPFADNLNHANVSVRSSIYLVGVLLGVISDRPPRMQRVPVIVFLRSVDQIRHGRK